MDGNLFHFNSAKCGQYIISEELLWSNTPSTQIGGVFINMTLWDIMTYSFFSQATNSDLKWRCQTKELYSKRNFLSLGVRDANVRLNLMPYETVCPEDINRAKKRGDFKLAGSPKDSNNIHAISVRNKAVCKRFSQLTNRTARMLYLPGRLG